MRGFEHGKKAQAAQAAVLAAAGRGEIVSATAMATSIGSVGGKAADGHAAWKWATGLCLVAALAGGALFIMRRHTHTVVSSK